MSEQIIQDVFSTQSQKPQINNVHRILKNIVLVVFGFFIGFIIGRNMVTHEPTPKAFQTELLETYTVNYPSDFNITAKNYGYFEVASNRFLGNFTHIPTAQIQVYTNVIPKTMNLIDWLTGVGNPNAPIGPATNSKSCKDFITQLKSQLKFGDFFNTPYPGISPINDCMYLGVSNIKPVTVGGIPALRFSTEAVSSGSTHTILKLANQQGVTVLIDMSYTLTGQSGPDDNTAEAYDSFLTTIKPANGYSY